MHRGLGEVLREIRLKRGISLRELSDDIGISHAYINKLEKGVNPATGRDVTPTMDTIIKIANGLSIPVKDLLEQCGYFTLGETGSRTDLEAYLDGVVHTLQSGDFVYENKPVPKEKLEMLSNAIKIGAGIVFTESSPPAAAPSGRARQP